MIHLPEAFTARMQRVLGEEYEAFLESYEQPRRYGLRVNTLKVSPEAFAAKSSFHLQPIDWIAGAYTYQEEDYAARHPYYHAGLYYLQEPSAMTPASILPVRPGDKVLDLCAAPGGKSTALGAKLQGEGLLVANDISASRCKALLKNIEVFGIPNALVTNAPPHKLAEKFPAFFDCVLVDAPCSGEGMFRKDEGAVKAWYPEKPADCAKVQRQILEQAVMMLRPGGKLLYSTCTFAVEEDEAMVQFVLERFPQMHLLPVERREGFAPGLLGLEDCVRLWPHRTGGEGHFLALLEKDADAVEAPLTVNDDLPVYTERRERTKGKKRKGGPVREKQEGLTLRQQEEIVRAFAEEVGFALPDGRFVTQGDYALLVPKEVPTDLGGITYLRSGLLLGQFRRDRFEPSQALAMAIRADAVQAKVSFGAADERTMRYLRGETVTLEEGEAPCAGWVLVSVDGYPLGWGKCTGSLLKNKYLAGWRTKY